MLPSELLIYTFRGEAIVPRRLPFDRYHLRLAGELIELFRGCRGGSQAELDRVLGECEGTSPDYRVRRGLVHLLKSLCTFETVSPIEPVRLRSRLFALAAESAPSPGNTKRVLETLATRLEVELGRAVFASELEGALFADLSQNQLMTQFDEPEDAPALLHRYNLSQVQGVFYRASHVKLNVHRNDPGEYKYLFRFLKLFGLMTYIEGEPDTGFTLTIDGPTSLFGVHTQYGLALAKLLPALLNVTRWNLEANLVSRDPYTRAPRHSTFSLDPECGLVSHYPKGKPFDSMTEQAFAEGWGTLDTEWKLEREVHLLPIPGSVMIPDFRLVHPDGRSVLLEIVGYWRPSYLKKKFSQVRKIDSPEQLMLAVSERLDLDKSGVDLKDLPVRVIWYRDRLSPRAVLKALEEA